MAEIAPAVLAETPMQYEHDMGVAAKLSNRVQIDLADGEFAENVTVSMAQVYWPDTVLADLHLMYQNPFEHIPTIISLTPHLAIAHAEARDMDDKSIASMRDKLKEAGIKFGLALLPDTPVEDIKSHLLNIDHLLVFTGELGHYGGKMRYDCLDKITQAKAVNSNIEAGVDGGINEETIGSVLEAGADVLNVGGYIQNATHPQDAYATLESIVSNY